MPRPSPEFDQREPHEHAGVGHFAVALADLAAGEGRAALGPPPDDLVSLVEQAALEEGLQRPPDALHVALVEGDVGLVEMDPEAEPFGQFFPLLHVAENALDALVDERLDAVGLDFLLGVDAQFLADLDFDRQPVGIPAGLALGSRTPAWSCSAGKGP